MALTLSGNGTITGLVAGGLPDATITGSDLAAGAAGSNLVNSTIPGNLTVTSGGQTFTVNDVNNYARFTKSGGSAQIGMFRSGNAAGGGYIGADEINCLDVRTATFDTRMTVSQAGRVSMPFQPHFRAHNANSASITIAANTPVQFTAVQNNIGSHYNGTSRFTAPVGGVYIFTLNLFGTGGSDRFGIAVNGTLLSNPYVLNTRDSADSGSFIIRLNASDYVEVMAQYGGSLIYGSHSGWMGYLLG
jgi:hypothetical protein